MWYHPVFTKINQAAHTEQLVKSQWRPASLNPLLFVLDGHSEAFLQQRQFADQVSDGVCKRLLSKQQHDVTTQQLQAPRLHKGQQSSSRMDPPHPSTCYLWAVVRCGLHSDDDLVFQRMRNFVASKQNLRILHQLAVDGKQKEHFHFSAAPVVLHLVFDQETDVWLLDLLKDTQIQVVALIHHSCPSAEERFNSKCEIKSVTFYILNKMTIMRVVSVLKMLKLFLRTNALAS